MMPIPANPHQLNGSGNSMNLTGWNFDLLEDYYIKCPSLTYLARVAAQVLVWRDMMQLATKLDILIISNDEFTILISKGGRHIGMKDSQPEN